MYNRSFLLAALLVGLLIIGLGLHFGGFAGYLAAGISAGVLIDGISGGDTETRKLISARQRIEAKKLRSYGRLKFLSSALHTLDVLNEPHKEDGFELDLDLLFQAILMIAEEGNIDREDAVQFFSSFVPKEIDDHEHNVVFMRKLHRRIWSEIFFEHEKAKYDLKREYDRELEC